MALALKGSWLFKKPRFQNETIRQVPTIWQPSQRLVVDLLVVYVVSRWRAIVMGEVAEQLSEGAQIEFNQSLTRV